MGKRLIKDSTLSGIADAIRAKDGNNSPMTPLDMPARIAGIPVGGGGVELPELANPAKAENIQTGFEAIGSNGEKITGTHVEEANLDTSDATATAGDIAENVTAYVNGVKVTGVVDVPSAKSLGASSRSFANGNIKLSRTNPGDFLLRAGKVLEVFDSAENFGDATAADVVSGKTFTSKEGLMVTGTGSLLGSHSYKQVTAPNAGGGTYGVNNKSVQLDKTKSYIFLVYYNNPNKSTFHFGTVTKGVLNIYISHGTTNSYNCKPELSSECVFSYGPGYDSDKSVNALIYEMV